MCEEVRFCTLLVIVQCVIDDELEVRGRGDGSVSVRHGRENEPLVRARDDTGEFVGDRAEGNGSVGATQPRGHMAQDSIPRIQVMSDYST